MKYAAVLSSLLALAACIACTGIEGSITSSGGGVGTWTLSPDRCMTGDRERAVGAALYTEKDPDLSVRIVRDIRNRYLVFVAIPSTCKKDGSCQAVVLDGSTCSRLSADVRLTNVMTPDDFRHADGFLSLDCTVYAGARKSRITGEVRFKNCN